MSVAEVAAVVSEALESAGLDAVLSGGSVVTIYSENEYESLDLDFVTNERMKALITVMMSIGFKRMAGRHFEHPWTRYYVEFPTGPLSVGDHPVRDTARLTTRVGNLRILTPTQCVMDRLAAFYYWHDRQGLDQAVMVARRHAVDRRAIEAWSGREGHAAEFDEFARRLAAPD
jgi:hypothetical protein